MKLGNQRLYDLVPAIYRLRDIELARSEVLLTPSELNEFDALEALPPPLSVVQEERLKELQAIRDQGPLKSLLAVIAEQVAVLEENLDQLYDDQFVETCVDWAVPYIGDLIGYRQLHGTVPDVASPRAEVANTIAYRRRKGTATVLEQLARDVTGWNARVVEFFQYIAGSQYMNHIRPHNQHTANLREWEPLERLNSAFDTTARTIDVRSPSMQAGRYNIPNIGIFLWRFEAYSLTKTPAPSLDGRRFLFSPLGHNIQLFTKPEAEKEITHLAEPINVPEPISGNVLDKYFDLYYGEHKSLYLWLNDTPVKKSDLEVCNLADYAGGWAHLPQTKIAIDPRLGRIALPPNLAGINECQAIHITGITGGSYALIFDGQKTSPINHNANTAEIRTALEVLSGIGAGNVVVTGNVTGAEVDVKLEFVGTLSGTDVSPVSVVTSGLNGALNTTVTQTQTPKPGPQIHVRFHYGFSADMGGGEYERAVSFEGKLKPVVSVSESASIQTALNTVKSGGAVEIEDSGLYSQSLAINVDADAHLALRTANEHRATLDLPGSIEIRGGVQSTVTLNGLLITGGSLIVPAANNDLKRLILRHCTLVPGLGLSIDGEPEFAGEPSLIVHAPNVTVVIEHCIVGAIRVVDEAELIVRDSIIDANDACAVAYADTDDAGPGAPLEISNSTVIGKVHTHEMRLASNVVFKTKLAEMGETWVAPVISEKKQNGCVRFSYVPVGSRVPRRYRCQPDMAVSKAITEARNANPQLTDTEKQVIALETHARIKPVFTSRHFGAPGYGQLSIACPIEIRTGADDEAEIGVFHDLYQPQRETNLRLRLDEYLRFGLEAGIFYTN